MRTVVCVRITAETLANSCADYNLLHYNSLRLRRKFPLATMHEMLLLLLHMYIFQLTPGPKKAVS